MVNKTYENTVKILLDSILYYIRTKPNMDTIEEIFKSNKSNINGIAAELLSLEELNDADVQCLDSLMRICNIIYNNTDSNMQIIDNEIYDLLMVLYKRYVPDYQVGSENIVINGNSKENFQQDHEIIQPFIKVDFDVKELLYGDLLYQPYIPKPVDLIFNPFINVTTGKTERTTKARLPQLVGTLDKGKFVLNSQAQERGVLNDSNVTIVERDFFAIHIRDGIIHPNDTITVALSIKYDGVSIAALVNQNVEYAELRGDTNESMTCDVSHILSGYIFPKAKKLDRPIAMKFEAIMTYKNLARYNELRNANYKNPRTAISSIFSANDGSLYRDFITLVPISTDLEGLNRFAEMEFLNKYYTTGEYLTYIEVSGTLTNVLFQIKQIVDDADLIRSISSYMYDGIVIEYVDEDIKNRLGRVNSVNKWAIAIKFNPLKKQTVVRGVEFTVGQDGSITPMVYYDHIEFYGTIHNHSSISSYERFNKLALRYGDIVDVEYVNEVMPYVTKPDNIQNLENMSPLIPFIDECPSCGTKLVISKSGKQSICTNINCPERNVRRVASMVSKLGFRDFAEERISDLGAFSLAELLSLDPQYVQEVLGKLSETFFEQTKQFMTNPIEDYKVIGSIGFTGVAIEKWKLILNKYNMTDIMCMRINGTLRNTLVSIKGIGPMTSETIERELEFFEKEIEYIMSSLNIIETKGRALKKTIRFTGFRDKSIFERLVVEGFEPSMASGVSSKTDYLLVPSINHKSRSITDAIANGYTTVIAVSDFLQNIESYK